MDNPNDFPARNLLVGFPSHAKSREFSGIHWLTIVVVESMPWPVSVIHGPACASEASLKSCVSFDPSLLASGHSRRTISYKRTEGR